MPLWVLNHRPYGPICSHWCNTNSANSKNTTSYTAGISPFPECLSQEKRKQWQYFILATTSSTSCNNLVYPLRKSGHHKAPPRKLTRHSSKHVIEGLIFCIEEVLYGGGGGGFGQRRKRHWEETWLFQMHFWPGLSFWFAGNMCEEIFKSRATSRNESLD